MLPPKNKE
jgi:hypothetical protein